MAIPLSLCNILAICRYLMNSLIFNIKCPTWNAWATSCLAETLKTHAGLVICLRYSIGRYQKHQQSLIYQMLLLTHSPMLHLDHPKGKLISSRRNELFCSLAMEFYHQKTPLKYTQLQPNRTTPNRSALIPLHLPLTSPKVPSWHCQGIASSWGSLRVTTGQWGQATSSQPGTTLKGQAERVHRVGSNEYLLQWGLNHSLAEKDSPPSSTFLGCAPSVIEYFYILSYLFIITLLSWFQNLFF